MKAKLIVSGVLFLLGCALEGIAGKVLSSDALAEAILTAVTKAKA